MVTQLVRITLRALDLNETHSRFRGLKVAASPPDLQDAGNISKSTNKTAGHCQNKISFTCKPLVQREVFRTFRTARSNGFLTK